MKHQPTLRAYCANERCLAHGLRDEVPAMDEHGHRMPLFEADEKCRECGERRKFER